MGNDWILAKTVVGLEEIETRARRVPPRLRTVLILVDGRRSVADLIDAAAGLGDVREALETLHDKGFVIRVGNPRPVAAVASRASAQVDSRGRPAPAPVPDPPANPPRQRRSLADHPQRQPEDHRQQHRGQGLQRRAALGGGISHGLRVACRGRGGYPAHMGGCA